MVNNGGDDGGDDNRVWFLDTDQPVRVCRPRLEAQQSRTLGVSKRVSGFPDNHFDF